MRRALCVSLRGRRRGKRCSDRSGSGYGGVRVLNGKVWVGGVDACVTRGVLGEVEGGGDANGKDTASFAVVAPKGATAGGYSMKRDSGRCISTALDQPEQGQLVKSSGEGEHTAAAAPDSKRVSPVGMGPKLQLLIRGGHDSTAGTRRHVKGKSNGKIKGVFHPPSKRQRRPDHTRPTSCEEWEGVRCKADAVEVFRVQYQVKGQDQDNDQEWEAFSTDSDGERVESGRMALATSSRITKVAQG